MTEHVAAVRRYLAAFDTRDPDQVAACVSDDFVNEHLSELGTGCVGRDEYRRRLPGFIEMFDGLHYEVVDLIADDRRGATAPDGRDVAGAAAVVVRYVLRARHEGHPIVIPGVMWFESCHGLVTRRTDLWDSLSFLRQTGRSD